MTKKQKELEGKLQSLTIGASPNEVPSDSNSADAIRMEDRLEFLAPRPDGGCALGCSGMTGRCWSGSVWLYDDCFKVPDIAAAKTSFQVHAGVPTATWVNRDVLALAQDGGNISWLKVAAASEVKDNSPKDNHKDKKSNNKEDKSQVQAKSSEDPVDEFNFVCLASTTNHTDTVNSMDLSADSSKLVSASSDCSIGVFDCATQKVARMYSPAHGDVCVAVATHPKNSNVFLSASQDGNVLVWDTRQAKSATALYRDAHMPVSALAWYLSDTLVLFASLGGYVYLTDTKSRDIISNTEALPRGIRRLVPCPKKKSLAVCGNHETVKVYNITNTNQFSELYCNTYHRDIVRDAMWMNDKSFLSCGWDNRVYSHNITPAVI